MNNNLVIYKSKNGTTKETVEKIKLKSPSTTVVDIDQTQKADLSSADHVFIGCGIYMGKVDAKIKKFISANKVELAGKKVTFFIHGIISQDTYKQAVSTAVSGNLDMSKVDILYLGGKLDIMTQNFIVRKMLCQIAKQHNFDPYHADTMDQAKIDQLIAMF